MKRLTIEAPGRAVWDDAPVPTPPAGEVLVRVEGVTTCPQWDLHIMHGEPMFPGMELPFPYYPGQPGHEMVGRVEQASAGVDSPAPGDRVVVWRDSGPTRHGSYAQFVSLPAQNLLKAPEDLAAEDIASLELAMCVQVSFDQVIQFGALDGKTVGITGLGPAGLIAVQIAKAMGAGAVIAYDPVATRRDLSVSLGADEALDPKSEHRTGRFMDVALDMTGIPSAIRFLTDHAQTAVAMFGVVREDVVFPASRWYGGFSLVGYGSHNLDAARTALRWVTKGSLRLAPLVTHKLGFAEYARGISLLDSKDAIKILFDPWLPQ